MSLLFAFGDDPAFQHDLKIGDLLEILQQPSSAGWMRGDARISASGSESEAGETVSVL
ncbi:hypothetical protein ACFSCV_16390 [Methylopila henanensis]|uniref:SH3 domain-containing protein n=1 Tax=Methylopila henanensis TaxID=873516 RepID=A0ABW4KBY5_9HYPH